MRFFCRAALMISTLLVIHSGKVNSQVINNFGIAGSDAIVIDKLLLSDSSRILLSDARPLFSFNLNDKIYSSGSVGFIRERGFFLQTFGSNLNVKCTVLQDSSSGLHAELTFENTGNDTISISNVVPFGEDNNSIHITGKGPWDLARAWLFRPGFRPVRVILPDNAWEMGYSSFSAGNGLSVCAIARRLRVEEGQKQRYETTLPPQGKVIYSLYAELFRGEWQNGLRLMFRDRYLHDLDRFDNTMFEREDLKWIRECYLIELQMAWDREFFDRLTGKYNYAEVIKKGKELFGKIDIYAIWPTWPRLGLDQRNQWDLYRDLPGGTRQLNNFARMSQQSGTRFFIAYNPWDNSTRQEDHYKGMAQLIAETGADGVVLDTRGSSSYELQAAADSVRKGVVMYSEGMAITKDMPGIIAGRVHNAIYLSPEVNLNKLIKPDFSIFRVLDIGEDMVHREVAIAFFNGYGSELNMYRPGGKDDDFRNDMAYLAKTTFILRQNNDAFLDINWTPLMETSVDNAYVNKWNSGDKTIYTILNMRPEGISGSLFKGTLSEGKHWVSLWNHINISPATEKGISYIPSITEGFSSAWSGTRREGSVDCIAELPVLIRAVVSGDSIKVDTNVPGKLLVWKGNPSYSNNPKEFSLKKDTVLNIRTMFGFYEGKIVLQLLDNNILKDENILEVKGGKPWLVSKAELTEKAVEPVTDMVLIPGSRFSFNISANEDFMPYPEVSGITFSIDSFLVDRYPVTNAMYYEFMMSSGYRPSDTTRFLRHWKHGKYGQGQEKYPVVYLSYEDMRAYASWAGKRLPTEAEWQLAAQGTDLRKWPWGNEFHGAFCNNSFARPTPVDAFVKGQSPYGAVDMVGNVWQMTNDMYFNGSYYMTVIRGGSYYKPESSWWYMQGGPQSLDKTQILLMVSPGFDRSPTVGFRCVKDIDQRNFQISAKK